MKEYYNLPILYTREERERYRKWGIKKAKILRPMAVLVIGIDLVVTVGTIIYGVSLAWGGAFRAYGTAAFFAACASKASWLVSMVLTLLIVRPLDLFFDLVFKKPPEPMMLRLEPCPDGVSYVLQREKKTLCKGVLSWQQWETAVYPQLNEIVIEDMWLKIGENTLQTIYPPHLQHKWMDHPAEKIVGTIDLGTIRKNMEGYLASLEEQRREAEWLRQNG